MAGFGGSVGDLVAVGTLAWNVYRACESQYFLSDPVYGSIRIDLLG
jgi:hypothetical protein